jgi:hypothetical protein
MENDDTKIKNWVIASITVQLIALGCERISRTLIKWANDKNQEALTFSKGVEIDFLDPTNPVGIDNLNYKLGHLVCIRGILYPENKTLKSFDSTPSVLVETTRQHCKDDVVRDIVPFFLSGWKVNGKIDSSDVKVDIEAFRRSRESLLVGDCGTDRLVEGSYRHISDFKNGGNRHFERSWSEFFSSRQNRILTSVCLPCGAQSSIIGRLLVSTDGHFLITAHPSLGLILSTHISFSQATKICHDISTSYTLYANTLSACSWCLTLGASVCFTVGVYHFATKYLNFPPASFGSSNPAQQHQESSSLSCVICLDAQREVLVKPCNHLAMCMACGSNRAIILCPLCRHTIRGRVRVYI